MDDELFKDMEELRNLDKSVGTIRDRTMPRADYKRLTSRYRRLRRHHDTHWFNNTEVLNHMWIDVEGWIMHQRLPDYLQYYAVSEAYTEHMEMRIADYGAMLHEMEIERQASNFHMYGNIYGPE